MLRSMRPSPPPRPVRSATPGFLRHLRRAALLSSLALACTAEFQPLSFLDDLRVLAVVETNPDDGQPRLDLQPGERITLAPHRVPPPGVAAADLREAWTFCPVSVGSSVAYACAVPACEVTLVAGAASPDGELGVPVTADPTALLNACLAAAGAGGTLPSPLPERFDVVFRYTVTAPGPANTPSGGTRVTVARVPFFPAGVPAPRNLPPQARCLSVGGVRLLGEAGCAAEGPAPALPRDGRVEVRVTSTPESAQPYTDSGGTALTERVVVSFFTDAGRFEFDRLVGLEVSQDLKGEELPEGATQARFWAVLSDLRGGQTVLGPFTLAISGG